MTTNARPLLLVFFAAHLGCSGGSEDPGSASGQDAGATDTEEPADAGIDAPPPLPTQYKDARRYVEFTTTGVSCASVCQENEGRCAMNGDTDPESTFSDDPKDCFGRADYYIPRAHYENELQNYFPNEYLACEQVADSTYEGGYTLYAVECCCMLEEPYRLANDIEDPTTCNEVCEARDTECRPYDLCRQIPGLCSESFPEFFVESIARYEDDGDGTGMETYPRCDEVPATEHLLSHTCMCF